MEEGAGVYGEGEGEGEESAYAYLRLCGEATLLEGLRFAKDVVAVNVALRLAVQHARPPRLVAHLLSALLGATLLALDLGAAVLHVGTLALAAYAAVAAPVPGRRGALAAPLVVAYLLASELLLVEPKTWHRIRGVQMILAMKIISLAVDLDRDLLKRPPNPAEFAGYALCPANCVFGPWISYQKYVRYMEVRFLTKNWFKCIMTQLVVSMAYLILSNCVIPWYISDDMPKWIVAYRDAQAFRSSHYFVSTMSIVSMISAGFALTDDCQLELEVTKPLKIELPRSLVQVVVFWNMPMHQWLKQYVFKTCQPFGQFSAIFVTYAISSLLHGLNFQLSAVLLSIGTFSYVEYKIRKKFSKLVGACCLANPCLKNCGHIYKSNSLLCRFLNLMFSFITVMHLAYLGVMFEASFAVQESGYSYRHTLSKWEKLDFSSHIVVAFTYLIYLLI